MTPVARSGEQFATAGTITLCFETFGSRDDPTLLLISGVTTQMVMWPEDLCERLAGLGLHVVRFDNRDVGRSSRVDAPAPTGLIRMVTGRGASYDLGDMADDARHLLDHLDVATAHVAGISMGGMIAQELALRSPDRVDTLTLMSSTPGSLHRGVPTLLSLVAPPTRDGRDGLWAPSPRDVEGFVEHGVATGRRTGAVESDADARDMVHILRTSHARGLSRRGFARQFAAVGASRSRVRALRSLEASTLVLHGTADPIFPLLHGRALARAIPDARLVIIDRLGHGIPRSVWDRYVHEIREHIA